MRSTVAKTMRAAALLGLAACLGACGSLQVKPLNGRASEIDCRSGIQQKEEIFTGLEDSLRRAGAYWTPKMKLFSPVGMIEKSARVYILNRKRHVLILHLMHDVELEIKDHRLVSKGDSAVLLAGVLRIDTRHTIGNMTDEYLYLELSAEEAGALAGEREIRLSVGDLSFEMPYACREPLREAMERVTSRNAGNP